MIKIQGLINDNRDLVNRINECKKTLVILYGKVEGGKKYNEIEAIAKDRSIALGTLKIDSIEYLTNYHLK